MKKVGLIGGLSYISSIDYYKIINDKVQQIMGGHHSCDLVLYSFDFDPMAQAMFDGNWTFIKNRLISAVNALKATGCELIAICCNSVHKVFDEVEAESQCQLFHIIVPTLTLAQSLNLDTLGILGTQYTMEGGFYKTQADKHGIDIIVPEASLHEKINRIIFSEICHRALSKESKNFLISVIRSLTLRGAQGIMLACTELPAVILPEDIETTLLPTTDLHAEAIAVNACKRSLEIEQIIPIFEVQQTASLLHTTDELIAQ